MSIKVNSMSRKSYIDSLGSLWEEICTKLIVCSLGVIQFTAGEERLD
jgi:hypothetical protein